MFACCVQLHLLKLDRIVSSTVVVLDDDLIIPQIVPFDKSLFRA